MAVGKVLYLLEKWEGVHFWLEEFKTEAGWPPPSAKVVPDKQKSTSIDAHA